MESMAGMRKRNRLSIMVKMGRMTRLTYAPWRNGIAILTRLTIPARQDRLARTSSPAWLNRDTAHTRSNSGDGLTWSARLTRATTPTRIPRADRPTRLPRVGRMTGLHCLARQNRRVGMARMTGGGGGGSR